jgi:Domain of Unknown Function (DUF1259)
MDLLKETQLTIPIPILQNIKSIITLYTLNTTRYLYCFMCLYVRMKINHTSRIAMTLAVVAVAAFSVASLQYFSQQTLAVAQPETTNITQQCPEIGKTLSGISVPSGNVCDVVVVRSTPEITGHNGLVLNKFTLMNTVIEFIATNTTSSSQPPANQNVYVMGDFALLESEMNPVLQILTKSGWTVTGIHNHMILESPKTTFVHWETQGDLNTIIGQIKDALGQTSIQGSK